MSTHILAKDLVEFGLSEREAKVYLSLLELEVATVNEVSKSSGVKRSSVYVVLDSLKQKGLVSTSEDKNIQRFVATSPDVLLRMSKEGMEKEQKKLERMESVVPELKALHKDTKERPKVRVFEGVEGFINALIETLYSKEKHVRIYTSAEKVLKTIPEFVVEYARKRIELNVKQSYILPDNDSAHKIIHLIPEVSAAQYTAAYLPEEKGDFPAGVGIWDDKIAYMTERKGETITIVIESQEIANVMKNLFDLALEESARLGRKETDQS